MSKKKYWGFHLILDCENCDKSYIKDAPRIRSFVRTLVKEIDMKAYGNPIIEYFCVDKPKVAGYSLMQLIETSSITGHFCDINGNAYIDIFSCKDFDTQKAIKVVEKFFSPKRYLVDFYFETQV